MNQFSQIRVKALCIKAFRISLIFSLPVFAFLRMIFYELPFSYEDGINLVKVVFAGFMMTMVAGLCFYSLVAILAELKRFLVNPGYNQPKVFKTILRAVRSSPELLEETDLYREPIAA